jgi:glycerophosphoryl diester phosphodiesterase
VLIHDQTVDRTTNGAGEIRALTMRQLGELDAAYSFSPDGGQTFPYRGQGVTIPTLESVFQKYPNAYYGIEIKQTTVEAARTFCGMIRAYSLQSQVLVSAFAQDTMDAFRAACPEVATSATLNESAVFVVASMLRIEHVLSPAYYSLQVPETYRDIPVLTPRLIEAARNRNLAVQPWTINSEADLKRIMALGVGGINTDYPDRLLALRNNVAK